MSAAVQPLISVIIATYKRADDLDRAIQSVRDEPGDYFEIVIGDDGSPDHTPQIVAKHAGDRRVRAYRNEVNLGMQENYLKIAREAQGRYLFILTDDDYLLPGALAKVKRVIDEHLEVAYILSDLPSLDERTGRVTDVHRTYPIDTLAPAGLASVEHMTPSAWVLSRQVLKREAIDWRTWETYRKNIFFPIIFAGRLILRAPAFYLADRLVMHTFFNQVHWHKFGRNELDIEFNLAADRFACMRAILHDCTPIPEVTRIIETWEMNSFKSYLYLEWRGYFDLVKALGRPAADEKLQTIYPMTTPHYQTELQNFWRQSTWLRARAQAKALLRRLPAAWLTTARRLRGRV
jgi:glycosyltransferase involved in cell wall biosynthesis